MARKRDNWCSPYLRDGKWLYGAAAREARIADFGGMDNIINEIREETREATLASARKWFERLGVPAE